MWTDKEIEFLQEHYPEYGKMWCCDKLNKKESQVRCKASTLGLRQSMESDFFKDWQQRAKESKIGKKRPKQSEIMKKKATNGELPHLFVKTSDEQKKTQSDFMKDWIKRNGHPKGFKGHKRSEEEKKRISER